MNAARFCKIYMKPDFNAKHLNRGGCEIFGVVFSKKCLFWPILNAAMPEESMSNGKKETMTTFKIWRYVNDFRIETENGKDPSA